MNFKEFILDVLNRSVSASWYRTVGCSPEEASFLADMEVSMNTTKRRRAMSDEEIETYLAELRAPYNETMSALAERRRKLYEDNPWLLERNSKQPETLESVCAASGDIDTYVAEKAKTDARYAAAQKEFQRIDASKAALEERRRKLYEENPELYERAEKCRKEVNRRREDAKKRKG